MVVEMPDREKELVERRVFSKSMLGNRQAA